MHSQYWQSHFLDLAHHLQAASKSFYGNRPYLVNRNIGLQDRLKYFNTVVTPVAVFGAANRKVYKQDPPKMDIVFRRLLPSTIGPLGDLDWTEELAKRQLQLAAEVSAEFFGRQWRVFLPQQLGGI